MSDAEEAAAQARDSGTNSLAAASPTRGSVREVAALFLKLGCIAFGGPAAHIAMMRDEVVNRRRWVSDQEFVDLLGATNLIPGPNSTEMAIHLGFRRAGWAGLIVGGTCFIVPAMVIVLICAWLYVQFGTTPQLEWLLYGVKPVIIAIVLYALWGLLKTAVKGPSLALIGVSVLALYLVGVNEIVLMFGAGAVVMLVQNARRWQERTKARAPALVPFGGGFLAPFAAQVGVEAAVPFSQSLLFLTFFKIGAVLYGSGYVLLAFVRSEFVERLGWLTDQQLLDAVAVGQFTPGPVFTTATFIGYLVGDFTGAILATIGIFLPGFLAQFGSNLVTVRPSAPQTSGARVGQVQTLTVDDAHAIREQVPHVLAVSGVRSGSVTAVTAGYSWNTQVVGVSTEYPSIQDLRPQAGSFFGPADETATASVAVLGSHAAAQLFGDSRLAIDQPLRLNGTVFRIVGVLAPRGQTINGNLDDVIYVPLATALRRLYGGTHLDRIEARAVSGASVAPTMAAITTLLKSRHRAPAGRPDDFQVQGQHQVAERATQTAAAISTGLTAGAALALVIAGFGLMNIMLVSVSERTPEIGVRLAVGARAADIRAQFLAEASALCAGGVAIGCVLGLLAAHLVSQRVGISVVPQASAFVVAGAASMAIGLVFGWYPAERAARLEPMVGLRSE